MEVNDPRVETVKTMDEETANKVVKELGKTGKSLSEEIVRLKKIENPTPYDIQKTQEKSKEYQEIVDSSYSKFTQTENFYINDHLLPVITDIMEMKNNITSNTNLMHIITEFDKLKQSDIYRTVQEATKKLNDSIVVRRVEENTLNTSPLILPIVEKTSTPILEKKIKPIVEKESTPIKLSDVFESESRYNQIMEILVESKLCQPNTFTWIDEKKGNKILLIVLLKLLHIQGYYKYNKKLTDIQIKEISQNTFGIEIGIDHIKHTKFTNLLIKNIPLASTLKF